jgi:uncharacterized RDD family membrane protein YckC
VNITSPKTNPVRYPHLAKEPLVTSRKRGDPENRFWAKCIDIAIILPILALQNWLFPNTYLLMPLTSLSYWTFVEGIGRGQSPGKWLLGLHTIEVQKGESPRFYNGLIRNLPFSVLSVAIFKTGLLWTGLGAIAMVVVLFESYFVFILRSGIRIGDILGYTRVYDFKDIHTQFIEQFLKKEEAN